MRSRGFTLLEMVLAIGLTGMVLVLLTTAIDLYLVRVDASRTQVESAQLARTLLHQIAKDLRAARYKAPPTSDGTESQGIFGSTTELRIDRAAAWQWELQHRLMDASNPASTSEADQSQMPQTVRYFLEEGKELLTQKLAAAGVGERPLGTGYSGLFRERISTAAWLANASNSESTSTGDNLSGNLESGELIAPEVVDLAFSYFDGEQFSDEWNSSEQQALPSAVEIRLTLLEEPFEQAADRTPGDREELRRSKENLVEYRLVVKLPNVQQPEEAEFPLPVAVEN